MIMVRITLRLMMYFLLENKRDGPLLLPVFQGLSNMFLHNLS
jgi:hypothetical protein